MICCVGSSCVILPLSSVSRFPASMHSRVGSIHLKKGELVVCHERSVYLIPVQASIHAKKHSEEQPLVDEMD